MLHAATLGAVAPYSTKEKLAKQQLAVMQGEPPEVVKYVGTRRQHSLSASAARSRAAGSVRELRPYYVAPEVLRAAGANRGARARDNGERVMSITSGTTLEG